LIDGGDQSSTNVHTGPKAQVEVLMKDGRLGQTADEHEYCNGVSAIKWLGLISLVTHDKAQHFAQKHRLHKAQNVVRRLPEACNVEWLSECRCESPDQTWAMRSKTDQGN